MQHDSNGWDESRQELGFLAATAVAGTIVSGLVLGGWWSLATGTAIGETDVVDQGLHRLTRSECHSTLATLLSQFRSDPRVLWVWVEQSTPGGSSLTMATADTARSMQAPRPYAFRPDVETIPAGTCGFDKNSLHAVSLGGVAGPFLEPEPDSWRVSVGP